MSKSKIKDMLKEGRNGILIPHLNDVILSSRKPRKETHFHPSGLDKCNVILVGKLIKPASFIETFSPQTLRIFDNGSFTHSRIQGYTRLLPDGIVYKIDDELAIEYKMKYLKYLLAGTCDEIIIYNDKIYVMEIKSMNDYGFQKLKKDKNNIGYGYKLQSCAYTAMARHNGIPAEGTLFFIENKNTQEWLEFIVPFDEKMWEGLRKRLMKLKLCVRQKRFPAKPYPRDSWQCNKCDWFNYCWLENIKKGKLI